MYAGISLPRTYRHTAFALALLAFVGPACESDTEQFEALVEEACACKDPVCVRTALGALSALENKLWHKNGPEARRRFVEQVARFRGPLLECERRVAKQRMKNGT